ncbi:DNA glycosylase [Apiospora arundinis]
MASRLSAELWQIIFSDVVGAPRNHTRYEHRVQERIKDLLNCCLVCRSWRYEAQRALQTVILITDHAQLQKRLTSRVEGLASVRQIIYSVKWLFHPKRDTDIHRVLDLEMPCLRSLVLREGIRLSDSKHKLRPTELANLAGLRELTLHEHGQTGLWQPLLLSLPRLEHLRLSQVGWTKMMWVHHEHETFALTKPAPFSLKSLEISSCHLSSEPLRWLLAKSAESLCRLSVENLQCEWDTLIYLSQMRAGGLLPNVRHLTFSGPETAHSNYNKHLPTKVTEPLTRWGGIETTYIRAGDAKMRAAIINGIAAVSPPPIIELDASRMKFQDLKAVFRVRKTKLQSETVLRLITKWDYDNSWEYWADEYVEDAQDIAQKNGVILEIDKVSHYT